MEIREIHLKHFGKFDGQKLSFHPGLNIIYGANETGKSTVCSFIRGMLFGIDRSRGRGAKKDEYMMRQPWENSGYFAGSMRFTSGGKKFFLDRSFFSAEKRVRLICETDGEELDVEHGDLAAVLEDITSQTFNNTFYYGNISGETDDSLAEEIHNYMVNASSGNFSQINITKACEKLRRQRKEIEQQKRMLVEKATIEAREIQVRIEYERQSVDALAEDEEQTREELEAILHQQSEDMEDADTEEWNEDALQRHPMITGKVCMAIMAAIGLLLGIFAGSPLVKAIAVGMIIFACLGVRYFAEKEQDIKDKLNELVLMRREKEFQKTLQKQMQQEAYQRNIAGRIQRLKNRLEWIDSSRREKEAVIKNLLEEYQEILDEAGKRNELDVEIASLHLAEETMNEVMTEAYQEYEDYLNERVSQILSRITDGKYDRILVDEKLDVKIYSEQRVLSLEQVSRGTMEQIYFALRMAVGELLNQGEPLPVILDDPFLTYDEDRVKNTLKWLSECGRQVLLFTCQARIQDYEI